MSRIPLAVAALLLLAGCSGVAPDPSPNPGAEGTTTAAEPATPPGVTDGELTDPGLLLREHAESVREHGARVRSNATTTVRWDDRTRTLEFSSVAWATADGTRVYRQTNRLVGALGESMRHERVETYANETTVVERRVVEENATTTTWSRGDDSALVRLYVARTEFLETVVTAGTFRVVDTERRNGTTVTTLAADDRRLGEDGTSVFDATMTVTADGRVRSLTVLRNPDANTKIGRRTYDATWSAAPEPTVPDWVP